MYGDYLYFTCLLQVSKEVTTHFNRNTPQDISLSNTHTQSVVLEGPVMSDTVIKSCVKDSLFLYTG